MKKLLFFLSFVGIVGFANAQNIIAGQYSASDYYHDYNPDTIIYQAMPGGDFYIDLNNDGINDFKFHLNPGWEAHGYQYHSINISALNNNGTVLDHIDTCRDYNQVYQFSVEMAHAFNNNDIIDSTANWVNSVYLTYSDWMASGHDCHGSYSVNPAYVGLKVIKWTDTLYAWVQIVNFELLGPPPVLSLTLGAYACNKGNLGIQNKSFNSSEYNIYPNPANDNLTFETSEKVILEVLNIEGQIISTIISDKKETNIDLKNFSSGVYILRAKTDRGVVVKKFIKE